jgi:hypothetical protein
MSTKTKDVNKRIKEIAQVISDQTTSLFELQCQLGIEEGSEEETITKSKEFVTSMCVSEALRALQYWSNSYQEQIISLKKVLEDELQ